MIEQYRVVAIIPARGGSKGLSRKNVRPLAGRPLIAHTIEQALACRYIDRVVVSTEDREIADIARGCGAEVPFLRPLELAGDQVGTVDVLLHAIRWLEESDRYPFDILVLLHVTTPLRAVEDIDACLEMLIREEADNVFSVTDAHRNPYFNMVEVGPDGRVALVKQGDFASRQEAPQVYDMNASIYVWWKDLLKKEKRVLLDKSRIYVMPKERSIDIDDPLDFRIAEFLRSNG